MTIATDNVACWNENASVWNDLMGEGSPFQREIVDQALTKLLPPLSPDMHILEIGCGNGFLARRFASLKATVVAIDSSSSFIDLAKKATPEELTKNIHYKVLDATQKETYENLPFLFDCVVSNMAFMDIADIHVLFEGASKALKKEGVFIVTQTHPCFEKSVGPLFHETVEGCGITTHTHGVKVSKYLQSSSLRVKAVPMLPQEHLFFHRSLSTLFQAAFNAGFVVNGLEEVAFPKTEHLSEHNGWHFLDDVPVIIGIRFKKI